MIACYPFLTLTFLHQQLACFYFKKLFSNDGYAIKSKKICIPNAKLSGTKHHHSAFSAT